jgi:hypothetical protein
MQTTTAEKTETLRGFAKGISEATGILDSRKLGMIENYMRNCYFNSTLDWIDAKTFNKASRESASELEMLNWQFV